MPQTRHYEMKDSGVEWIGKMPRHWRIERAKFHFRQSFERGNSIPELLAATQKHGMYPQRLLEGVVQVMAGTDLQQFKSVHINDFVISLRSFQGGFERSDYEGVCSPAYQVFHADKQYDVKWLKWFFKNDMFIDAMNALTVGIREGRNIKFDDFANSLLPVPPLSEQTAIAAYLDEKCATIDAIVSEAKASIEEYKSWKASVIFETVTKGLNPYAEMKDSGVEWIGEMPKDWDIVRFKRMHRGSNVGLSLDKDYWSTNEDDTVFYTAGLKSIHTSYKDIEPEMLTKENDLLLARNGTPYVYFPSIGAIYTDHIIRVGIENGYNKAFVRYCLQQSIANEVVDTVSIATWSVPIWNRQCLPHPSLTEQTAIAAYLDEKCAAIDGIILEKEELIRELENYKRSLIFEAVTGKRRVC